MSRRIEKISDTTFRGLFRLWLMTGVFSQVNDLYRLVTVFILSYSKTYLRIQIILQLCPYFTLGEQLFIKL